MNWLRKEEWPWWQTGALLGLLNIATFSRAAALSSSLPSAISEGGSFCTTGADLASCASIDACVVRARWVWDRSVARLQMVEWYMFAVIGIGGGLLAGLFGIGGGIILISALVVWAGFSQHLAVGTSLAVLLPPIGLGAVLEYYRHGNVNVTAAIILALTMFLGSWLGAYVANKLPEAYLRLVFGVFVFAVGIYFVYGSIRKLGWL